MAQRGPQYHKKPGHTTLGQWSWNDLRLWSKIDKTPDENGCHNWQGAMSPTGALLGGWKSGKRQMSQARRFVFMSITGEDVTPYQIALKCANQRCCNFEHFEIKQNNRPDKQ